MASILLEARSYRPFKTSEEYLYAMKEDLAEWLNTLYPELDVNVNNFMDKLETGVVLCKHANNVRKQAQEYLVRKQLKKTMSSAALTQSILSKTAVPIVEMGECSFKSGAKPSSFFARDNVSNFIGFARKGLEILECLLFETEDLISRKNEKNVILCLLEVARKGAKYGMLAPILVQMEREIDRELAADRGETAVDSSDDDDDDLPKMTMGPIPQIVTNDLKSLDEMVRDLLEMCSCPTQFPMIRVSEGKYRIGDTKVLIFVRVLRNHVMVRVGGGWDTLAHYLDKHDPCRCRGGHRAVQSSKLVQKNQQNDLNNSYVVYERSPPRTRRSSASSTSSGHGGQTGTRSRSPTPRRDNKPNLQPPKYVSTCSFTTTRHRSASPNPAGIANRTRSPQLNELSVKTPRGRSRSPSNYEDYRGRSRSPAVSGLQPNKERQGRSRSPSGRLSVNSSSYHSATASSRNRSKSPSVQPVSKIIPVKCRAETVDGKSGDSDQDVSDEGYRSPGLIVTTPLLGETKVVTQDEPTIKIINNDSPRKKNSFSAVSLDNDDIQHSSVDDGKRTPLHGSSNEIYKSSRSSREQSVESIARSSPERSRKSSIMEDTSSSRRRSSLTRSRSASSRETLFETPVSRISGEKCGTWNGNPKSKRSVVNADTFQRGGPTRSSLGARKTEYDPLTGRRVQKNVSPIVSDLLQVQNLEDDKLVLQKMKELISQYSEIFDNHNDNESISGDDSLHCHSRKDSKYEGHLSKIPAPVIYKQPSSEKEC